jgi:hypothetical protein
MGVIEKKVEKKVDKVKTLTNKLSKLTKQGGAFKLPTLLQVRAIDDHNRSCVWYAEAVGRVSKYSKTYYEGFYLIESQKNPGYLKYDVNYELIPEESVMSILPVNGDYKHAWGMMGFRVNGNLFLKISEPSDYNHEDNDDNCSDGVIGSEDSYSTESSCSSDVSDLIDDNDECGKHNDACMCNPCVEARTSFRKWVSSSGGYSPNTEKSKIKDSMAKNTTKIKKLEKNSKELMQLQRSGQQFGEKHQMKMASNAAQIDALNSENNVFISKFMGDSPRA